jgi:multicomponent Na+:H+ antiporter subunit D
VMTAGAVMTMTGRRHATDLGGLWRSMPVTMACCVIGTLSIMAFPLTSGFVTKSMIAQAAADEGQVTTWLLLTAASVGTLVYLSLPWFLFFQRDSGLRPPEAPAAMRAAMILLAALCVGIGIFPGLLYTLLPYGVEYVPYTADHVFAQLQILGGCALVFFLGLRFLQRRTAPLLDVDWLYRTIGPRLVRAAMQRIASTAARAQATASRTAAAFTTSLDRHYGPAGRFGRTVPVSQAAVWVVVLLLAFLVAEFT